MISVVITEVVQFFILSIASFAVGIIAMRKVAPEMLHRVVPAGWDNIFFGWHLNLDWSTRCFRRPRKDRRGRLRALRLLRHDAALQGHPISPPAPRPTTICSACSPRRIRAKPIDDERLGQHRAHPSALLSDHWTHRAGAAFFGPNLRAMGTNMDFELVLPYALGAFVPVGLLGFLIAGLLAAFMSNFAATVNAAPPYFVNDIYKRFINPNASPKTYVRLSYLARFQ
jgi:solute:Na+ symporter, SSS family